jgi:hypothetical protein
MNKKFTPTLLWAVNGVTYSVKRQKCHVILPLSSVYICVSTPVLLLCYQIEGVFRQKFEVDN